MSTTSSLRPLAVVLLAGAVFALPASSARAEVRDEAGFFKPATVQRADEIIRDLERRYKREVLVETVKSVPEDRQAQLKALGKNRFFAEWGLERARAARVNGLYVFICQEPSHLQLEVGNRTAERAFTGADRNELRDMLIKSFRDKEFDQGLLDGLNFVSRTMESNLAGAAVPAADHGGRAGGGFMGSLMGFLCVGIVVLLVVWVVFGLIRAFTGGGAAAPGYGGMGGYGGGGGFMSGLLGGMFGAMAGHWIYDSFFGGHHGGGGWGESNAYGGSDVSNDVDTDYSGTGGDFGDSGGDTGGGDFGGGDYGGGDFGGGDFGGGDFGGGDF